MNTKLVSEMIEKGDFSGIKDVQANAMSEGSQNFEEDIARLITQGLVDRKEGLAHADSTTNLIWRLQNSFARPSQKIEVEEDPDDTPSFTEITLDVHHE